MADNKYLTLLRGINVGGNSIIKMADLKACFEKMGYTDVQTYIQSGNVIFRSVETDINKLIATIENGLSEKFNINIPVVVITHKQMKQVVETAPPDYGKDPDNYRYDVIFVKEPLTTSEAMSKITPRQGIDNTWHGESVLYFSRLTSKAGQSYLSKVMSLSIYKLMTIRNWNTTTKLLTLIENGK